MRILHYFLGFPPWRSGGMTKLCTDLMAGQAAAGEAVFALWPGRSVRTTRILSRGEERGILSFEIAGPLPVPLDEGVYDPSAFMKEADKSVYASFLDGLKPDVIHIHTLMGLHREFLEAALERQIPTVYTVHDYYGICPKVTLFRNGAPCEDDHGCADCGICCEGALTPAAISLLQSPLYRKLKETALVRGLRRSHRRTFFEESGPAGDDRPSTDLSSAEGFRALRAYYSSMIESVSVIHCASHLARRTLLRYLRPKACEVFPITHRDIVFRPDERPIKSGPVHFAYFGGQRPYKGAGLLLKACDMLCEEKPYDFVLDFYGDCTESRPYLSHHEAYTYADLPAIMNRTDAVIVPSLWEETFGFTVPEAVSFGVPVIASDRVGAAEYLGRAGVVTAGGDAAALEDVLASLTRENLQEMHDAADTAAFPDWETFVLRVRALYGECAG